MAVGSDASNIRARASHRYQQSHIPDPPTAVDAGKTSALIIDKTGEVTCSIYRCGLVNFWAVGRKKRPAASVFADSCREFFVAYSVPFNAIHENSLVHTVKNTQALSVLCVFLCGACMSRFPFNAKRKYSTGSIPLDELPKDYMAMPFVGQHGF